jgi:hypothetical protein
MNKLSTFAIALALAVSMTAVSGSHVAHALNAPAQNSATSCDVTTHGLIKGAGGNDHRYTINNDGTVTARFTVTGENCKATATLVTWTAPNGTDGKPYSAQKMFSHTSGTFKPGVHSITTKLPTCYFQVDLITGTNWSSFPAGTFNGNLRSSLHGGTQSCAVTPPVTPPVTPTTTVTVPQELAKTGASANAIVATVLATVVASTVAFRGYLVRKNA